VSKSKTKAQQAASRADRKQQTGGRGPGRGMIYAVAGLAVFLAIGWLAWPAAQPSAGQAQSAPVAGAERIDVVYFHRSERCASCNWAEQASRKVVESYFGAELASGRVTFREVDVQKAENAALARQYQAMGSSLFINYVKDGVDNIVHASDTYAFIGNEARFGELLRAKVAAGLGASS
jgi:hypothetical protein